MRTARAGSPYRILVPACKPRGRGSDPQVTGGLYRRLFPSGFLTPSSSSRELQFSRTDLIGIRYLTGSDHGKSGPGLRSRPHRDLHTVSERLRIAEPLSECV